MSAIKLMVLQVMVDGFWVEIAMTKVEQINFGGVVFHIIHDKQRNFRVELNRFFLKHFELEW